MKYERPFLWYLKKIRPLSILYGKALQMWFCKAFDVFTELVKTNLVVYLFFFIIDITKISRNTKP